MNSGLTPSRMARTLLHAILFGALLVQAVLVQTHVHAPRVVTPALSTGQTVSGRATPQQQISSADYCPLCWEAAMAGHYSLPPAAAVPVSPPVDFWLVAPIIAGFGLAQPPHGWLSRAPPR